MSISNLQNAPWMGMNVGSVVQPIQLNTVLGNCDFFGVVVPSANHSLKAYILGDVVILNISLPSTVVTASQIITFANPLPLNLRPTNAYISGLLCTAIDSDDGGNSQLCDISISVNGVLIVSSQAPTTNAEHYELSMTVMYALM